MIEHRLYDLNALANFVAVGGQGLLFWIITRGMEGEAAAIVRWFGYAIMGIAVFILLTTDRNGTIALTDYGLVTIAANTLCAISWFWAFKFLSKPFQ